MILSEKICFQKSAHSLSGSTILAAPREVSRKEKWPWHEREQDFQGAVGDVHRFRKGSDRAKLEPRDPPRFLKLQLKLKRHNNELIYKLVY